MRSEYRNGKFEWLVAPCLTGCQIRLVTGGHGLTPFSGCLKMIASCNHFRIMAIQGFQQLAAWAAVIGALIASITALLLYVFRDILLEGLRQGRRRKRELVEAKLREIYSPMWVRLGGEEGALTNILGDKQMRTRIGANFHLLSPEMKVLFEKLLLLGKVRDDGLYYGTTDGQVLIDLQPIFVTTLKNDLKKLQDEFDNA